MRHLTKLLLGLVVLLQPWTAAAQQPPLAFGVLNQQSPALTAERWNPILHYASTVSSVPLQLKMGRADVDPKRVGEVRIAVEHTPGSSGLAANNEVASASCSDPPVV